MPLGEQGLPKRLVLSGGVISLCRLGAHRLWPPVPRGFTDHVVAVGRQHLHLLSGGLARDQCPEKCLKSVLMCPQLLPGLFGGPYEGATSPFDGWHGEPVRPLEGVWG